jgi:hypothetical protein
VREQVLGACGEFTFVLQEVSCQMREHKPVDPRFVDQVLQQLLRLKVGKLANEQVNRTAYTI